ncbi:hypothetical protein R84B8_01248 [Treponema sp. R8-4-B8]
MPSTGSCDEQTVAITADPAYWAKTEPLACFAILPVSRTKSFPATWSVTFCIIIIYAVPGLLSVFCILPD